MSRNVEEIKSDIAKTDPKTQAFTYAGLHIELRVALTASIPLDRLETICAAEKEGRCVVLPDSGIGDLSDGYHTYNELYHHRAILFSVICNATHDKAWKSLKHDTGDMYDGMFIVGIETPEGQATYHYDINPYWDMFKVKELPNAPKWDGHTPSDAIRRIGNLPSAEAEAALKEEKPNV